MPAEERFLADEGVDFRLVTALRERYPVVSIAEENPSITDDEVLQLAVETDSVLLTEDKDFGEMVFRRGLQPGQPVFLVSCSGTQKAQTVANLVKADVTATEGLQFYMMGLPQSLFKPGTSRVFTPKL